MDILQRNERQNGKMRIDDFSKEIRDHHQRSNCLGTYDRLRLLLLETISRNPCIYLNVGAIYILYRNRYYDHPRLNADEIMDVIGKWKDIVMVKKDREGRHRITSTLAFTGEHNHKAFKSIFQLLEDKRYEDVFDESMHHLKNGTFFFIEGQMDNYVPTDYPGDKYISKDVLELMNLVMDKRKDKKDVVTSEDLVIQELLQFLYRYKRTLIKNDIKQKAITMVDRVSDMWSRSLLSSQIFILFVDGFEVKVSLSTSRIRYVLSLFSGIGNRYADVVQSVAKNLGWHQLLASEKKNHTNDANRGQKQQQQDVNTSINNNNKRKHPMIKQEKDAFDPLEKIKIIKTEKYDCSIPPPLTPPHPVTSFTSTTVSTSTHTKKEITLFGVKIQM